MAIIVIKEGLGQAQTEDIRKLLRQVDRRYTPYLESLYTPEETVPKVSPEIRKRLLSQIGGAPGSAVDTVFNYQSLGELNQHVRNPNAYVAKKYILQASLNITGRALDILADQASQLRAEAERKSAAELPEYTFTNFAQYRATLVARFVRETARVRILPRLEALFVDDYPMLIFIFYVAGQNGTLDRYAAKVLGDDQKIAQKYPWVANDPWLKYLEAMELLLKKIRSKRSILMVKTIEEELHGAIRMNAQYADVLKNDQSMKEFGNGQQGVLIGVFGELQAMANLRPGHTTGQALAGSMYPIGRDESQQVDMELPLPNGKIALIEIAATIDKLRLKLGGDGAGQRSRYERLRRRKPVVFELGYSVPVPWWEMINGDPSPASQVLAVNRGLLLDHRFLKREELAKLLQKIVTVQEKMKIQKRGLLVKMISDKKLSIDFVLSKDAKNIVSVL